MGSLIGGAAALAFVPVPVSARGVVSMTGAPQSIPATVAGRVSEVLVEDGAAVGAGAPLVRVHSTELQLALERRRRELELLGEELAAAERADDAALARSLAALEQRRGLAAKRLKLKDDEFARRERLLDDVSARVLFGSAPESDILEQQASLQATREARLGIVDDRSQLDVEISDRRSAREALRLSREARLETAEAQLHAAERSLRLATVEAPHAGWIESLAVVPGSLVQPGDELARLVPRSTPRRVVALLPLGEAVHARVGVEALVELRPPLTREGRPLRARVQHVSREVAPREHVSALLGNGSPERFVQLDLELLDTPHYRSLGSALRSGSTAVVTLTAPERSLGGVIGDALRRWAQPLFSE